MDFQPAFLQRQRIQHAGDTMGDGLTCDVIDIQARQQDTDSGEDQIQQVSALGAETARQPAGNEADEGLEQHGRKSRCDAHDKCQQHDEGLLGDVLLAPQQQAGPPVAALVGSGAGGSSGVALWCFVVCHHMPRPVKTILMV